MFPKQVLLKQTLYNIYTTVHFQAQVYMDFFPFAAKTLTKLILGICLIDEFQFTLTTSADSHAHTLLFLLKLLCGMCNIKL